MTMLMTSEKSAGRYNKHNKSKEKKTEKVESWPLNPVSVGTPLQSEIRQKYIWTDFKTFWTKIIWFGLLHIDLCLPQIYLFIYLFSLLAAWWIFMKRQELLTFVSCVQGEDKQTCCCRDRWCSHSCMSPLWRHQSCAARCTSGAVRCACQAPRVISRAKMATAQGDDPLASWPARQTPRAVASTSGSWTANASAAPPVTFSLVRMCRPTGTGRTTVPWTPTVRTLCTFLLKLIVDKYLILF